MIRYKINNTIYDIGYSKLTGNDLKLYVDYQNKNHKGELLIPMQRKNEEGNIETYFLFDSSLVGPYYDNGFIRTQINGTVYTLYRGITYGAPTSSTPFTGITLDGSWGNFYGYATLGYPIPDATVTLSVLFETSSNTVTKTFTWGPGEYGQKKVTVLSGGSWFASAKSSKIVDSNATESAYYTFSKSSNTIVPFPKAYFD